MALMFKNMIQAFLLLSVFTLILGGLYPFSIYLVDHYVFGKNKNKLVLNDKVMGSMLLGQTFTEPKYFWGRPLADQKQQRIEQYNQFQNKHALPYIFAPTDFPADFITASASGLDPHISYESAMIQIDRVSRETGRYRGILENYILLSTEKRQFGFMGQPRVNVVKLNLLIYANE